MNQWCDNCGLCCMHMRSPPFCGPDDPQWVHLPRPLKDEIEAWVMSKRAELEKRDVIPCLWLDLATGRCKNYELRPDVCRDYQVGETSCMALRQSVGLTIEGMPVVQEDPL